MDEELKAHVLCRGSLSLAGENIVGRLYDQFGLVATDIKVVASENNALVLHLNDLKIRITLHNHALPTAELEVLHGQRRDTDGLLLEHTTFVTLSLLTLPKEHESRLKAVLTFVQFATCILLESRGSAVFWPFSLALLPTDQFVTLTEEWTAHADTIPLLLLFRIALYENVTENGSIRHGIFGVGFFLFLGWDIEFEPDIRTPNEMAYCFEAVARYSMVKGPVLKDSDTCGSSETESIRVRHLEKGLILTRPVLMCTIERLDTPAPVMLN